MLNIWYRPAYYVTKCFSSLFLSLIVSSELIHDNPLQLRILKISNIFYYKAFETSILILKEVIQKVTRKNFHNICCHAKSHGFWNISVFNILIVHYCSYKVRKYWLILFMALLHYHISECYCLMWMTVLLPPNYNNPLS